MNNRLLCIGFAFFGVSVVCCPLNATARQTIIIGSLQLGYDYWERTYDEEGGTNLTVAPNDGDKREYSAWPEIKLESNSIHDTVSLRYAPVLRYDDLYSTTDVDHYLDITGERFLTKDWNITLRENYVLSNDPSRYGSPFTDGSRDEGGETSVKPVEQTPDQITQNLGRRRYWTNDLLLETTYTYAYDSNVGLGYALRILRDESSNEEVGVSYDEYDKHELSGRWSYRFNQTWKSNVDVRYLKGLYKDRASSVSADGGTFDTTGPSQDVEEYWGDLGFDYAQDLSNKYSVLYGYRGTQYEDFRPDIAAHELTFEWSHVFDSRNQLVIGGGPSYVDAQELDGEWGYNAYCNFTRTFQHGSISALVDKRYEPHNFTGSGDTGLTDTTDVRIDGTYQLTKDLSTTIFGEYRYEDIIDPQGVYYLSAIGDQSSTVEQNVGDVTYSRESYSAGVNLVYTILRWLDASLRYEYYMQDGDLALDSYTDHRITFVLTASKELWR